MKKNILISSLVISLQMSQAFAVVENTFRVSPSSGNQIDVTGPADRMSFANLISSSGSSAYSMCNSWTVGYDLARVDYVPRLPYTGTKRVWAAGTYTNYLFETGSPGITVTPYGGSRSANADIPAEFSGMPPTAAVVWRGNMPDATRKQNNGIRLIYGVYVYKGAERLTGAMTVPEQTMYQYNCVDTKNVVQEINYINLATLQILGTVTGCTPNSKSAIINMDGVPISTAEQATESTLINTKQQTFSLQCDPNINLSYSVVDLNDPTNNSTISTLTSDSSATGIGYALTTQAGTRIQFGPEGSAPGIPGQQKYFIGVAGTQGMNSMSHTLGFSYVRKSSEPLKTGSVKSLIGITYSYQ
ncbi:fimbrial protein [Winslowiella sp. 2C04]|uniref:fimbrial protein n=1 Tax=Winslowiella sp. 2C04 TaxID=3416179 RepID=UPI003CF1FB1F